MGGVTVDPPLHARCTHPPGQRGLGVRLRRSRQQDLLLRLLPQRPRHRQARLSRPGLVAQVFLLALEDRLILVDRPDLVRLEHRLGQPGLARRLHQPLREHPVARQGQPVREPLADPLGRPARSNRRFHRLGKRPSFESADRPAVWWQWFAPGPELAVAQLPD